MLLVDSDKSVPKGKYRKQLKKDGHEAVIEVKRNFSSQEIKNLILRAFKISDYNILNCTDGKFIIAKNHLPAGDDLIDGITRGKFPLYIEAKSTVIELYPIYI